MPDFVPHPLELFTKSRQQRRCPLIDVALPCRAFELATATLDPGGADACRGAFKGMSRAEQCMRVLALDRARDGGDTPWRIGQKGREHFSEDVGLAGSG